MTINFNVIDLICFYVFILFTIISVFYFIPIYLCLYLMFKKNISFIDRCFPRFSFRFRGPKKGEKIEKKIGNAYHGGEWRPMHA